MCRGCHGTYIVWDGTPVNFVVVPHYCALLFSGAGLARGGGLGRKEHGDRYRAVRAAKRGARFFGNVAVLQSSTGFAEFWTVWYCHHPCFAQPHGCKCLGRLVPSRTLALSEKIACGHLRGAACRQVDLGRAVLVNGVFLQFVAPLYRRAGTLLLRMSSFRCCEVSYSNCDLTTQTLTLSY